MKHFFPTVGIMVLLPFMAMAEKTICSPLTAEDFLQISLDKSGQAKLTTDLREKASLAKQGIRHAELCLQERPDFVPCTYSRAVNRGLELQTRTFKIKSDLAKMVRDFEFVIARDGDFDHGGAYVALGYVYLKSPALTFIGDYSRDVGKAKELATRALTVAPTYPLNLKLAGEVAFQQQDYRKAQGYFRLALNKLSQYKSEMIDFMQEKRELKRWLKKVRKKMTRSSRGP